MIEGKIADGGGVATISLTNLAKLCGVSTARPSLHRGRSWRSASSASRRDHARVTATG